jgi:hypothetical protein
LVLRDRIGARGFGLAMRRSQDGRTTQAFAAVDRSDYGRAMLSLDLWIKALHVVFAIARMAGLLCFARLFVNHADARVASELSETLKVL